MSAQRTILIIDDERNFCRILEAKLQKSAFRVVTAFDAATGLGALLRDKFHLVLLDIHLPDTNGLDALPRLRALAPSVPFILMTAYEEESLRSRALRAGAVEVLYKPFDLDSLVQLVLRHSADAETGRASQTLGRFNAFALGQVVVLHYPADTAAGEFSARIEAAQGETFAIVSESPPSVEVGGSVLVRLTGDDGLYEFRTKVTGRRESGALTLVKPRTIHRRQRRKHSRMSLSAPVQVRVELSSNLFTPTETRPESALAETMESPDVFSAMLIDLSLGGVSLIAERILPPASSIRLRWTLESPALAPQEIQTEGEIVRVEEILADGGTGFYRLAIRFTEMSAESQSRVREFTDAFP